ncbi:MAG: cytochrome c3 family protein [Bdellovibrionota bacterium]
MKFLALVLLCCFAPPAMAIEIAGRFDHDAHLSKVFKANKIDCTHCHNFSADAKSKEIKFNDSAKNSILKMPVKAICHECHRSDLPQYKNAPKACFTCHRNMEEIGKIKPQNHENVSWKTSHAAEARTNGDACLNCHMTSQCAKCHLQRNDIEMNNHPKNFKFFHSVQARAQPQKCDACHTKSFCVACHMGKK